MGQGRREKENRINSCSSPPQDIGVEEQLGCSWADTVPSRRPGVHKPFLFSSWQIQFPAGGKACTNPSFSQADSGLCTIPTAGQALVSQHPCSPSKLPGVCSICCLKSTSCRCMARSRDASCVMVAAGSHGLHRFSHALQRPSGGTGEGPQVPDAVLWPAARASRKRNPCPTLHGDALLRNQSLISPGSLHRRPRSPAVLACTAPAAR